MCWRTASPCTKNRTPPARAVWRASSRWGARAANKCKNQFISFVWTKPRFFFLSSSCPSIPSLSPFLRQNNPRSFEWQSHFPIKSAESSELSLKFLPSFGEAAKGERRKGWCGGRGGLGRKGQTWKGRQWYRFAFDSHQYEADVIRYKTVPLMRTGDKGSKIDEDGGNVRYISGSLRD